MPKTLPSPPGTLRPQAGKAGATAEKSAAPAVSRAAAILRLLGASSEPLGVQTIARVLGVVPSSCLHLLRTLVAEDLVQVDASTKRYSLGGGLLTLASQWLNQNRFGEVARPVLARMSTAYGLTMIGVQVFGLDHMIAVAIARSHHLFQLETQIGSRFPALTSATGRCVAAFGEHDPAELRRRFKELRWHAAPSYDAWQAEVRETRLKGYAVDRGNFLAGVTIIAAPVLGADGQLVHALVAAGISEQMRDPAVEAMGRELRDAGSGLSLQLGRL